MLTVTLIASLRNLSTCPIDMFLSGKEEARSTQSDGNANIHTDATFQAANPGASPLLRLMQQAV